ncbi:hypothetical protein KDD30_05705 [Photobacterium sp. GJ3]|uniref:hypothetical protein n=1 Tax=Photobacterium sp. GJ3 TaxID=2829502 RepID=UPI001B8CDBE3|nr:hypothetical protein [Photobacterium sp. GJ3]QUJ68607.1 hypothetical protein KDD30_05705 [Photobacterium sp. GJ3]
MAAAAVLGGTGSALSGGKFENGAVSGAFSRLFNDEIHSDSSQESNSDNKKRNRPLNVSVDYIGKIWSLPNTIIGLIYGGLGHLIGEVGQFFGLYTAEPSISFDNNAIQFENNPLMLSAMTLGNVIVYGNSTEMQPTSLRYNGAHTLGFEEMQHTYQAQILGPFYFPAHIVSGLSGLINNGNWHGGSAFLERGPHRRRPTAW